MNIYIIVNDYHIGDLYGDYMSGAETVAIFGSLDKAKTYLHTELDAIKIPYEVYKEEMKSFWVDDCIGAMSNVSGEIVYSVRNTDLVADEDEDGDELYSNWYILRMEVEE